VTARKKYRTLAGLDYPSNKDGKRRMHPAGVVVDDLPPSDIKQLLRDGSIEPADDDEPLAPAAEAEAAEGQESEG
jgi:hypothetical protein